MYKVLVVDDELSVRESTRIILKDSYAVITLDSGESAIKYLDENPDVSLIFLDILMPGMSGLEALKIIKARDTSPEVVMVTATRTVKNAVEAMKYGAFEYVTKPFDVEEIKITAERAIENHRLVLECASLKQQMEREKEQFYKQLEQKVRERTAELEETNQKLRETHDQLVRSEKLASLGELIAGVAHELNNKLLPILAYAQLLKERELPDDTLRYVNTLEKSAEGATSVVSALLNFARPSSTTRNSVDLNGTMRETLALLDYTIKASDVHVDLDLDDRIPLTMADEKQISQVFLNILNNAVQAMKDGAGTLAVTSTREKNDILFTISDTGCGISDDHLMRIFDPFFSTKGSGGTGLGLSVSHGLIRAHGGEISVTSTLGKGTTFTIRLPITKERKQAVPAESSRAARTSDRYRVLIADDDAECRSAISTMLKAEHDVVVAEDGEEALTWLAKEHFDLLIVDCVMPGLSGVELYKWVLNNRAELKKKVVFITGEIFVPEIKSFLESTGCQYITKPFAMDNFKDTVHTALSES
jgi:signal transduction histidine kinase